MSSQPEASGIRGILNGRTLPVYLMFFFWGFGTGGLWLVRPLFAYQIGGSFLLVALISSVSAAPRIITAPLVGTLADRFGRKPFVILGAVLHIGALTGDFFVQSYMQFLLLEIVAGIGIATWMTSSTTLLADATRLESRGRAVAFRESSSRVGLLTGPLVGGLIAALFELRWVFLFIAATKAAVIVVTVLMIRESRKRETKAERAAKPKASLDMFKSRSFAALGMSTLALGLVVAGTGAFRTLFPVQAETVAGLSEVQIGNLIAVAGVFALVGSIPAGMATDRFGRKRPIIAGMLITALSVWLMAGTTTYVTALAAVVVFGIAESVGTGTVQVYAMDLAPEDRRGAFLGVWFQFQTMGQILGPLVIGGIADLVSFTVAFYVVVGILATAAIAMFLLAQETARKAPSPMKREGPG